MPQGQVTLAQIVKALEDLGGEATKTEIIERLTKNRNNDYSHYLNYYNYTQTASQVIQQHCLGYEKYIGPTRFEKIGRTRFRLLTIKSEKPQIVTPPAIPTHTPIAVDIEEPAEPGRSLQETYRILRDTALAREVKEKNCYKCQICGQIIELKDNKPYAEAHHVKPLGTPHNGPDVYENIVCVCPNHHVLLDYGAIPLEYSQLPSIRSEYIDYHNELIHGKK